MHPAPSVLVVGGYGTVGSTVCTLALQRNPELDLVVAGRRADAAADFAAHLPGARSAVVDVTAVDPLAHVDPIPDVVVVAVNDHSDHLLQSAVRRGSAVVDVARWPARVDAAARVTAQLGPRSPVVLASGWMASAASLVVAAAQQDRPRAHHVDIDILLALADGAGRDSLTGFIDIHRPFTVHERGTVRQVTGLSDPRTTEFSGGRRFRTRRLPSPEQQTLVATGVTAGAAVRIAFDSQLLTSAFAVLVRTGAWATLPRGARFRLLHNPSPRGAAHEFQVTVYDDDGSHVFTVIDDAGQAHLTAAGAVTQVERVLGLRGRTRPPAGISYPEQASDPQADLSALKELGVHIAAHPGMRVG